ncbi:tetratricopeptide repeat protein [uncultured Ruegeria sp.]|uniref:tetratricopeptide repeat protein n=1 Tax=uncultured Ruegeria sp. TaxID=259304 RepID=UPI00260D08D7|nr:tetratricopeptide repeat protein [uncultured Ruegeria sp.]
MLFESRKTLLDASKRKLLLGGVSGVGKTHLLREIQEQLGDEVPLKLNVAVTSKAQKPAVIIQKLAEQIAKSESVQEATISEFFSELNNSSISNVYRLGMALLGDVAKSKLAGAEGLANELAAIVAETDQAASTDAQAQALSEAAQDDVVLAFKELIQAISRNGQAGSLSIDGLENASSAVVETVTALVAELPESWSIMAAVNIERPDGMPVFAKLAEMVNYGGGETLRLDGLDVDGVADWMEAYNPAQRDITEIETALVATQGRAFYVRRWLDGHDLDDITLALGKQVAPAYQARFSALSPPTKAYLARVCVLPIGFSDHQPIMQAMGNDIQDFNHVAVFDELRTGGFLDDASSGAPLPHDETRDQILSILGPTTKQVVAGEVLHQIESLDLEVGSRDFELLTLQSDAGRVEQVRSTAPSVAAELVEVSPEAADLAFGLGMEGDVDGMTGDERSTVLLNQARAMIGTGRYPAAIEFIDQADDEISAREMVLRSSQVRLKALLRLNRYPDALTVAQQIMKLLPSGDELAAVEALRNLNTVHRDLSDAKNALGTAKSLKRIAKDHALDSKTASRIWRSIARTYAIHKPGKAIKAAKKALAFADDCGRLREIGNAYLALGEAYRHNSNFEKAISAYGQSIKHARALGNVDSLLWATLGKADAELLSGDLASAESTLQDIKPFFSEEGRRHPLEALHWNLSIAELAHVANSEHEVDIDALFSSYAELGISWPAEYYRQLQINGKSSPKPL